MLGPLHQNQHFFEGPTPNLSKLKFPPYRKKSQTFDGMNVFFLIAPRDLHFLGPLRSNFSAPEDAQQLFLPLGMPQNEVSSLRIAHIAHSLYF